MQDTQVRSLCQKDPLENEMATHCSILAWRIPWTEEPGGLQSMGLQKSDLVTKPPAVDNGVLVSVVNGLSPKLQIGDKIKVRGFLFPFLLFFFAIYITTNILKTKTEMVGEADSLGIWKHCECGFAVAFLDSGKLYWS